MTGATLVIVVFIMVWVTGIGAWYFLTRYNRSSDVQKVRERLMGAPRKVKKENAGKVALFEVEEQPTGKLIPRLIEKYDLRAKIREIAEQAGTKVDPIRFVQTCLFLFVGGYIIAWLFLPPAYRLYGFGIAIAMSSAPIMSLLKKRAKRLHAFEEVFPDSLEFIARSMRAGHAFSVSLEMIHREFPEPLSGEFRRAFEEHNLGLPLDVALESMGKRVPLLDVHFFVSAVLLQKRTGGNLAEILDKLAYVIRERFKLRGRIKAISAHGKMTGMALTSIPIAVGVLMFFTNPDYVTFFIRDETGNWMLGGGILLQFIGYLIIRKIVSIEV
jgi:tight adherence protein B